MPDVTLIHYALTQLDGVVWLRWGVMIVLTIVLIRTMQKQNRQYSDIVTQGRRSQERQDLLEAVLLRGKVALGLWSLLVGLVMYMDVAAQITQTRIYPEVARITPAESTTFVPYEEEVQTAVAPEAPVQDVDTALDQLKVVYEDALVSYLILNHCGEAGDDEYVTLSSAMMHDIARYGDSEAVANNIIAAAQGSYQNLYRRAPCDGALYETTRDGFQAFLQEARGKATESE